MRSLVLTLSLVLLASTAIGCAGSRQIGLCADNIYTAVSGDGDLAATLEAAEAAWASRGDTARLQEAITQWEKALTLAPGNHEVYERLARANYFMADGHLRFVEDAEEQMLQTYEKGTYYAELGLGLAAPSFRDRVCAGDYVEDVVTDLSTKGVPSMYWYATNLGKWALATGLLVALGNKDKIFAMMTRIKATMPDYFYGAAERYFGAFYTKIPFPGGDEELSKENFESSKSRFPDYLATRVLMADLHATKFDNRAMFVDELNYVLAASADVIPEIAPENAVEQKKAAALMEDLDDYFDEE
jgi:prepilin-type processing-associated H-X9-DG protein